MLVIAALCAGCSGDEQTTLQKKEIASLKQDMAELRIKMSGLSPELELLKSRDSALEKSASDINERMWALSEEILQIPEQPSAVNFNSQSWAKLATDDGTFYISIKDAAPYLGGLRIKYRILNANSVSYKSCTIAWQYRNQKGVLSTKKEPLAKTLGVSCATTFEVVFGDIDQASLGAVRARLSSSAIEHSLDIP